MKNPFTDHPSKVNETYFEHMLCACRFFIKLQLLSFAALVHAVFPFMFEFTASGGVKKLNDCMQDRKSEAEGNKSNFPPNDFPLTEEGLKKYKKKNDIKN